MYKLISMDFDGTLLNDKKQVTEKTKQTLLKYKNLGYYIVGVTARTLYSAINVAPLELFDYLILDNGAYIYDVKNETGSYIGKISKKEAGKITNLVANISKQIDFVSGTTYYIYKNKKNSSLSFIKDVDDIDELNEDIARMNIYFNNQNDVEPAFNKIKEKYNSVNCFIMQDSDSPIKWIVINPPGIDKKVTLEYLGKNLNITLHEMIFFGDGLNDLEVMKEVGCGVAMGNALEKVKKEADKITTSNNEDGIVTFLSEYLNELQFNNIDNSIKLIKF